MTILEEIRQKHDSFTALHGHAPLYIMVAAQFPGGAIERIAVKLNEEEEQDDDAAAFRYVDGLEGLLACCRPGNPEGFTVLSAEEFLGDGTDTPPDSPCRRIMDYAKRKGLRPVRAEESFTLTLHGGRTITAPTLEQLYRKIDKIAKL